jgi:hypothetical protein
VAKTESEKEEEKRSELLHKPLDAGTQANHEGNMEPFDRRALRHWYFRNHKRG